VNRGLKRFFHSIGLYILLRLMFGLKSTVWAGPLANHPFNFNFIFLSDGATAAAERATCFADPYRRYPVLFRSDERT
jgi:hypothetical protein